MKFVILCFALITLSAHARVTATEALQLALPENEYEGTDPFNEDCTVDVIRQSGQTTVTLWNSGSTSFVVVDSAPYELDQAREFFSSTIVVNSGANIIELTFSTKRVDQFNRLVTFQRVFRNAEGQQWTSAQTCTLDN